MANNLGLPFGELERVYNSRRAQELSMWAAAEKRQEAFHRVVFEAFYFHGKNIADTTVLQDLAAEAGLCPQKARAILDNGAYRDAVDADWQRARENNIVAAPTFLLNGSRLVGAQPYEKLSTWLAANGIVKRQ